MRLLDTLLLAAGIGRGVYGRRRVQKILPLLGTVAMLGVAAAAMMGALAVGGMVAAYLLLMQQGISQASALFVTGMIAFFIMLVVVAEIRRRLSQLKLVISTPVSETMDAFIDGLVAG